MTRFGYNILSRDATLRPHLEKINPGGLLYFQNDLDEAKWAKARFPNAAIVVRFWPDADVYKQHPNPMTWVEAHKDMIGTKLIVQTVNEAGFTDEAIAWHTRLLTYLYDTNIDLRVGILGLNVGTPKPEEWSKADDLFRAAAKIPERVYLILHEYMAAVITSGFIGGDPDNAGVAHGQAGGTNMIPMSSWPTNPQAGTMWHVGRYTFLRRHLHSVGIPVPKIIIGEFGADYLSDIDAWLKTLHSTQGQYDVVDGWLDLLDMWRQWYPNLTAGEVYMLMAAYADLYIYDQSVVAILFFARGNNGSWKRYQTDPNLDPWLEKYAAKSVPVVTPPKDTQEPQPPKPEVPPTVIDRAPELVAQIKLILDRFK